MTRLTVTPERAEAALKARLQSGRELRAQSIEWGSREELDAAVRTWVADWQHWQKLTATVLTRTFDDVSVVREFNSAANVRLRRHFNYVEEIERVRITMDDRLNKLELITERLSGRLFEQARSTQVSAVGNSGAIDVFIVHGHDLQARAEVARFVEKVGLNPIILEEQPDVGLTVIEKFERDAAKAAAAIVLLTPDDVGRAKGAGTLNPRARRNVVFELGYFAARLGRGRVFALVRADVEIPSDYRGVIYTVFDDHGGWKLKVAQNLKSAELPVDPEKLLQ
jgi:predicted nucleotide-binding protein